MINRINIKNFKCFSDATIDLRNINVLTGVNAAGKSTVIQALLLAFATMKEKENSVDVNNALGIQIGNPQALVSQNPSDNCEADFSFSILEGEKEADFFYSIDRMAPLSLLFQVRKLNNLNSQIFYLNAERRGPRMSYPAGGDENIKADGSNAAYIVEQADMRNVIVPEKVRAVDSARFSEQVEAWMDAILGDVKMLVSTDLAKASTDIRYKNELVDHAGFPTMTGFGLSYIFSVVAMGLWCSMDPKHRDSLWFSFTYEDLHTDIRCEPHMKLIREDSDLRIYFYWKDNKIAEGKKVLIGRIGRHPWT